MPAKQSVACELTYHTLTLTLTHSHTNTLTHSHTHTLTRSHTHTLTLTHTHTHTHAQVPAKQSVACELTYRPLSMTALPSEGEEPAGGEEVHPYKAYFI